MLGGVKLPGMSPVQTAHRAGGGFQNPWGPASQEARFGAFLKWVLLERPRSRRTASLSRRAFADRFPASVPSFPAPRASASDVVITWIGHSSFLMQIGGRNLLLDPVWSDRASPFQWLGPQRWTPPGIPFDTLPPIDAVLISHDHYDHLDDTTVRRLARLTPAPRWYAPLGVGAWLERRGARGVTELDWWDESEWADPRFASPMTLTATPAQHFSGRGVTNRNQTLWCGWGIRAGTRAVWFVGDTGRHPMFADIGKRLGPLDAVLMPIGAYNPQWFMAPVHVAPEDAVAGFSEAIAAAPRPDGQVPMMVGMHWGTFKLTDEPVEEPPARTRRAWSAAGIPADRLWLPAHGETRVL
jgi:N-acyl-phosphatidylethanolamine-hydrolysing phospholipase D